MSDNTFNKLSQKYYGPYNVVEKIGQVAYRLDLPPTSKIHDVFHVSLLKASYNNQYGTNAIPTHFDTPSDTEELYPESILERGLVKRGNVAKVRLLVKWVNKPIEDASWIMFEDFTTKFPSFDL